MLQTKATGYFRNWARMPIDTKDPSLVLYLPLWYPYSDMTGSTIYSYDKNRRACTVTAALWSSKGRTFDGTDDYIDWTEFLSALGTGAITFLAWVKPTTWVATDTLFASQILDSGTGVSFLAVDPNAIKILSTDSILATSSNETITVGVWQQLGFVRSAAGGASSLTIYSNATVRGTGDAFSVDFSTSGQERIGATGFNVPSRFFDGIIGDVLIYNKALSQGEILQIYQKTRPRYI